MRATIDKAGRLVLPKALRDQVGLRAGEVNVFADGETYSVLTRLPPPARLTPAAARRVLHANFPHTRFLGPQSAAKLLASLPGHGLAGGSVYDALVGAVAKEHGIPLGTRDRRAAHTYHALELDVEFMDGLGS